MQTDKHRHDDDDTRRTDRHSHFGNNPAASSTSGFASHSHRSTTEHPLSTRTSAYVAGNQHLIAPDQNEEFPRKFFTTHQHNRNPLSTPTSASPTSITDRTHTAAAASHQHPSHHAASPQKPTTHPMPAASTSVQTRRKFMPVPRFDVTAFHDGYGTVHPMPIIPAPAPSLGPFAALSGDQFFDAPFVLEQNRAGGPMLLRGGGDSPSAVNEV